MEKTTVLKVLNNGIKMFFLEGNNNFELAQRMLDVSSVTDKIDASCAYEGRMRNDFVGTYVMKINRYDDYVRFSEMLKNEKCFTKKGDDFRREWFAGRMEHDDLNDKLKELEKCGCPICTFRVPTMDEWKNGLYKEEKYNEYLKEMKIREIKIGKVLLKAGYSQAIVDFYSTQIKTEKVICLTISDRVQDIVGMSHYSALNWDGYHNSSCQDPRHSFSEAVKLAGALHDDKLFVGMLHDNLDELDNMQDKLQARTLFRLTEIEEIQYMIPTEYYGNNETKDLLHNALLLLEEVGIYTYDIHKEEEDGDKVITHREHANGAYSMMTFEDIEISETIEEHVECECPMCSGTGRYSVYSRIEDEDVRIDCPMCSGEGTHTAYVYEEIETIVEHESEEDILPYDEEGFDHHGRSTTQRINISKIERDNIKYGRRLV